MNDEYLGLREAFYNGYTIQAWHLNEGATTSADGRWVSLSTDKEPAFTCPVHLYRVDPSEHYND